MAMTHSTMEPAAVPLQVDAVTDALVGRRPERAALDDLLAGLRAGRSAALVLHGDAGIGKTALLDDLRRRAGDCAVASVAAAPSERDLAFAALDQLCRPLLDGVERLPEPRRAALRTTLGLAAGVTPEPLFLGLAVLSLLEDAGADRPLLCVVDDAQWLDPASSAVLAFVARRLAGERVAIVFGAREAGPDLAGLPALGVTGLAHAEAQALLLASLQGPLDERVLERLVAEAGGNPDALLAVARGSAPARLAGGFGEPDAAAPPSGGDAALVRRLAALDDATRVLLLVAAAEPLGEPLLLWRAAEELGIAPAAADAA